MNNYSNKKFSSPTKSSSNSSNNPPRTIGSKKKVNRNRTKLEEIIQTMKLPNSAKETRRKNQNPDNAILIDEKGKKVYKFGLWKDNNNRCIRNEFIAYTLLLKYKKDDVNIHYPQIYDCLKIPKTNYAMIILEYIPKIKMIKFPNNANNTSNTNSINNTSKTNNNMELNNTNNNMILNNINTKNLISKAKNYLNDIGISHNDEKQNLYYHKVNNKIDFLWIDFETATFKEEKLNMCSKLLLQNNVKINIHHNTSPTKKRKQNLFSEELGNNESNNSPKKNLFPEESRNKDKL